MSSICSISRKEMMNNLQRYFHKDHFTMTNLYGGLAHPPHTKIIQSSTYYTGQTKQSRLYDCRLGTVNIGTTITWGLVRFIGTKLKKNPYFHSCRRTKMYKSGSCKRHHNKTDSHTYSP